MVELVDTIDLGSISFLRISVQVRLSLFGFNVWKDNMGVSNKGSSLGS